MSRDPRAGTNLRIAGFREGTWRICPRATASVVGLGIKIPSSAVS